MFIPAVCSSSGCDSVLLVHLLSLLCVLLLDLLSVVQLLLLKTHLVALLVHCFVVVHRVAFLQRTDVALHSQSQQQFHHQSADDEVVDNHEVFLQFVPLFLSVCLVHDLVDDLVSCRKNHNCCGELGHEGGSDEKEEDSQTE